MDASNLKAKAIFAVSRTGLKLQKKSPEILLGVGLIGIVTAFVMVAKASREVDDVIEELKENLDVVEETEDRVKEGKDPESKYSQEDLLKIRASVYAHTGIRLLKLYGPSIALGSASLAAILASHGMMSKRQASLIAAYNVLNEGFKTYRKRVADELGEETDRKFRLGLRDEIQVTEEQTPDGKKNKIRKTVQVLEPDFISQYARFFDESSPYHKRSSTDNLFFLNTVQRYMNDKLAINGHVFLNEVYDALGLPRSSEGAIVGWLRDSDDPTHLIDFGVFTSSNQSNQDFVNGYSDSVLLDFNVDGIIYDLIR